MIRFGIRSFFTADTTSLVSRFPEPTPPPISVSSANTESASSNREPILAPCDTPRDPLSPSALSHEASSISSRSDALLKDLRHTSSAAGIGSGSESYRGQSVDRDDQSDSFFEMADNTDEDDSDYDPDDSEFTNTCSVRPTSNPYM